MVVLPWEYKEDILFPHQSQESGRVPHLVSEWHGNSRMADQGWASYTFRMLQVITKKAVLFFNDCCAVNPADWLWHEGYCCY